jgi:hypothetical protein
MLLLLLVPAAAIPRATILRNAALAAERGAAVRVTRAPAVVLRSLVAPERGWVHILCERI